VGFVEDPAPGEDVPEPLGQEGRVPGRCGDHEGRAGEGSRRWRVAGPLSQGVEPAPRVADLDRCRGVGRLRQGEEEAGLVGDIGEFHRLARLEIEGDLHPEELVGDSHQVAVVGEIGHDLAVDHLSRRQVEVGEGLPGGLHQGAGGILEEGLGNPGYVLGDDHGIRIGENR